MEGERQRREQLVRYLLSGSGAHAAFEDVVREFPAEARGRRIPGIRHRTRWEILEHMRICQRDILDYMTAEEYEDLPYPGGHWPRSAAPPNEEAWEESLNAFLEDRESIQKIVEDPAVDLTQTVPHSDRHTYLRELLIVGDHNSYHIGQLVQLAQQIGIEVGIP